MISGKKNTKNKEKENMYQTLLIILHLFFFIPILYLFCIIYNIKEGIYKHSRDEWTVSINLIQQSKIIL